MPSRTFDLAARMRLLIHVHVHVHCTICQHDVQERIAIYTSQVLPVLMRSLGARILPHAHAICMYDTQQRVTVQYILARSCPCRCVRLEPGYIWLVYYALCPRASCVYTCHITRGGIITRKIVPVVPLGGRAENSSQLDD